MVHARASMIGVHKHVAPRCQYLLQGVYRHGKQCSHSATADGVYCRKHSKLITAKVKQEEEEADTCMLCCAYKPGDTLLPCATCQQPLHVKCLQSWAAEGGIVKCPYCNGTLDGKTVWYIIKDRLRRSVESRASDMNPEVGAQQ